MRHCKVVFVQYCIRWTWTRAMETLLHIIDSLHTFTIYWIVFVTAFGRYRYVYINNNIGLNINIEIVVHNNANGQWVYVLTHFVGKYHLSYDLWVTYKHTCVHFLCLSNHLCLSNAQPKYHSRLYIEYVAIILFQKLCNLPPMLRFLISQTTHQQHIKD